MASSTYRMAAVAVFFSLLTFSNAAAIASTICASTSGPQPLRLPLWESGHGAVFNITVGNPPQTILTLSDWTWQTTWVDTAECEGVDNVTTCIPEGQPFFNDALSTTYKNISTEPLQTYNGTDYTPGIPFKYSAGTDTVCIEGFNGTKLCQDNSQLSFSMFDKKLPFVEKVGAIFGYAPVLPGFNKTYWPTTYQMLMENKMSPVVGWHMCMTLNSRETCEGADALTIIGGTETSVYDPAEMIYHPIVVNDCVNAGPHLSLTPVRNAYWSASWTGFWVGETQYSLANPNTTSTDQCNDIDPILVMDQDGFGHGMPVSKEAFDYLVNFTGAVMVNETSPVLVNGGPQGLWTVDCSKTSTFPNVTYELTGIQNMTATPEMYIDTVYTPGTCYLNARLWERDADGAETFFGLTNLAHTYVEFNYLTNMVGLAPLNQDLYA